MRSATAALLGRNWTGQTASTGASPLETSIAERANIGRQSRRRFRQRVEDNAFHHSQSQLVCRVGPN